MKAFILPENMFGVQGRCADFAALEREIGSIPRHPRTIKTGDVETRFFRVPAEGDESWPTSGLFRKFNLRIIASGERVSFPNAGE